MPNWCRDKFRMLFSTVIQELDLGPTEITLEMGKEMTNHQLTLPPGNLIATLMTSMPMENNYSLILQKEQV
jgi:hypothetical protein